MRDVVFSSIAVPQIAIVAILAGSVWHVRPDAAQAAAFLIGVWGLWYLAFGFSIKSNIEHSTGLHTN